MGQLGQPAGLPAGTILAYGATWNRDATNLRWNDPNGVQSDIQGNLAAQYGIVIDAQSHSTSDYINFSGKSGFVLQVHITSDYGAPPDIQSVIDGAIYGVLKQMPQSTIRVVQAVSTSTANPNALLPANVQAQIAAAQAGYTDALSRGDQVSAAQYAALIRQLGAQDPRGVTGWLADNWKLLAALGVGLVAVKELV